MNYINHRPIAILMAAYNAEKYIGEQIDSIINQTNQDWMLYIRDDASTDSTPNIIANYCFKYENIIFIKDNLGNLGCYENFKQLLRVIDSNYYMLSDADDYWLPEKVQISYDFIRDKEQQFSNIPLLTHCDRIITDENLNIINPSLWASLKFDPDSISDFKYVPLYIVGGACSIFNNKIRDKYLDPSPFKVSHDGWIALQTSRYGKIFAIHKPLILYRRHGSNTTVADANRQSFKNQFSKLLQIKSTLAHHNQFASQLEKIGYGSKTKYYYYRIVLFFKLLWYKLTIR